MKASTLISVGLWTSGLILCGFITGCSTMNRAESARMLDRRADYEERDATGNLARPTSPVLKEAGLEGFGSGPVPIRTRPKVASIWIHPHEMASHDYFWGGWMSVVIEADQWLLSRPNNLPQAPGITDLPGGPMQIPAARAPGDKPRLKLFPNV